MFSAAIRSKTCSLLPGASVHRASSLPHLCTRFRPSVSTTQSRAMHFDSYLVSPAQLNSALQSASGKQNIVPLCGSWFLPNDPAHRTGEQTYRAGRIPGARFFDLDEIKDPSSPYPHMLPAAEDFAKAMGRLGIGNEDTVVVYDTKELGIFSAPRVAWTLRGFGHKNTHVLNNFRLWADQGYPLETGPPQEFEAKTYKLPQGQVVDAAVDFDFVKTVARGQTDAVVLDARPKGRFEGRDPEPRPGLPSGHLPGSISVPFGELLDPDTKALLPPEKLKEILQAKGITGKQRIVSSCGTGVTAAIIDAALEEAGYPQDIRLLYDGSWTEWAQRVKPEEKLIESS